MKTTQKTYQVFLILVISLILTRCANPVAPQGGPKDETPPQILAMDPPNYSVSFTGQRLIVHFDEFVKLQNLNNQLMISPALEKKPLIKPKGKSIVIDIQEKLRDSTTYTFFFGDAIVDITEGNPLKNFEYVFSTGTLLDSMAIRGKVLNAFDMTPKEGVPVLLYSVEEDSIPIDSLPMKSRPFYVSRTNKEGEFELNNLRNIPYKLVALADMNGNYLYDLPNEEIAFSDTIIMPAYLGKKIYSPAIDTASSKKNKENVKGKETESKQPDNNISTNADSTKTTTVDTTINAAYKALDLFMFPVYDSVQGIIDAVVSKGSLITFRLKYPCKDFKINPLNFYPDSLWNITETYKNNDSILCWVKPGIPDSLKLEFIADSVILDTLDFVLNKVNPNARIDTVKARILSIMPNIDAGKIELDQKLTLESEYPLSNYDFSEIKWFEDTLVDTPPVIFKDSAKRIFYIDKDLNEKINYKIMIPDSAMVDIKGRINDSLVYEFNTKLKNEYGTITVNATTGDTTQNWIVQLIDAKKIVVAQQIINKSQPITFDYIIPEKYTLKAILDENKNGHWDTGNYIKHQQAEKVLIFKTELEVRANWVMEQNWELK